MAVINSFRIDMIAIVMMMGPPTDLRLQMDVLFQIRTSMGDLPRPRNILPPREGGSLSRPSAETNFAPRIDGLVCERRGQE